MEHLDLILGIFIGAWLPVAIQIIEDASKDGDE